MKGITPLPSPDICNICKHTLIQTYIQLATRPVPFSQLSTEENIIPHFHTDFNYIRVFLNYIRTFQLSLLVIFICNFYFIFNLQFYLQYFLPYGNTFCFVKETKERIDRRISNQFIPEKKFNRFSNFILLYYFFLVMVLLSLLFDHYLLGD